MAFNKAESGSAVLVDVNTGEVLAMANSPSYNPNNLSGTPKEAMRNRTITDVFEPGSTVKPMVVMTALQRGVVRENSVLNTIPYRINGHEIKDVARYSELTLTGVLQKSSNVGVFQAGVSDAVLSVSRYLLTFWTGKSDQFGGWSENAVAYILKNNGGLT
ncbi:peptidoglycan synthetase FtsI [Escherichia coli]|uniref:Peptidoglycan synthetase FtsI n=1 Tax=Escherichia coli TaxID=562 RepID=A0A2X1JZ98_ECOLX|nr:peptidoglycan synthetase FtsI [Escherichia coli]